MTTQPYSILFIASAQLFPHIEAIIHYRDHKSGLSSIAILHSADEKFSKKPALQLEKLLKKIFSRSEVKIQCFETGTTCQEVTAVADQAIEKLGSDQEWIINTTGGLKMMAFGLSNLLARPATSLIYLDAGKWWHITQSAESHSFSAEPMPEITPLPDTAIPLTDYLRCQDSQYAELILESKSPDFYRLPDGFSLPEVLRTVGSVGWHWKTHTIPFLSKQPSGGAAFECFIGAFLCAIGIKNFIGNVEQRHAEVKQTGEENDFFVLTKSKVFYIDVSLASEGANNKAGATTQMIDAVGRSQKAGQATQCIMIRPAESWNIHSTLQTIIKAKNIKLLDATGAGISDTKGFFQSLAETLGVKDSPLALDLDKILVSFRERGAGALTKSSFQFPASEETDSIKMRMDIGMLSKHFFQERRMPIFVLDLGNCFFIRWNRNSSINIPRIQNELFAICHPNCLSIEGGTETTPLTVIAYPLKGKEIEDFKAWIKKTTAKLLPRFVSEVAPLPLPPSVTRAALSQGEEISGTLVLHPSKPDSSKLYFLPEDYPHYIGNTGISLGNDKNAAFGQKWRAKVKSISLTAGGPPPTYSLVEVVH